MTSQIAIKLPEKLLARLDDMVARGLFPSRSAAVRRGLDALLDAHERGIVDHAFREAFRKEPDTDDEMREAYRLAVESIHDEVWEKWW